MVKSFDWVLSTFRACGTVALIPKPQYEVVNEDNINYNEENLHLSEAFLDFLDEEFFVIELF